MIDALCCDGILAPCECESLVEMIAAELRVAWIDEYVAHDLAEDLVYGGGVTCSSCEREESVADRHLAAAGY